MKYNAPEEVRELALIFRKNNYSLYLVGGAVRDFLLGRENSDFDLTTSALPEEVKAVFRRTIDTGIKHGTVTVIYKKHHYEITTFRTEGDYSDSRHPDSVTFIRSLDEDLKRRDFTVNALAVDILTGTIIDNHGGMKDLETKTIRAIGEAEERFGEDALRMMRAARFSAKLDFTIEEKTLNAIKKLHGNIKKVSVERIKEELDKTLLSPSPEKGLEYLDETGLLCDILPKVKLTTFIVECITRAKDMKLGLSSFYAILFYGMKEEDTEKTISSLKPSNSEKKEILTLTTKWPLTPSGEKREETRDYIRKVGKENTEKIIALKKAFGKDDPLFEEAVKREIDENVPLDIKSLEINGNDLLRIVKPGPDMGKMLEYLMDEVIKDPENNTKEKLMLLAEKKANPCS